MGFTLYSLCVGLELRRDEGSAVRGILHKTGELRHDSGLATVWRLLTHQLHVL